MKNDAPPPTTRPTLPTLTSSILVRAIPSHCSAHSKYIKTYQALGQSEHYKKVLRFLSFSQENFNNATDNVLSFQPKFDGTFKTTSGLTFNPPVEQASPFAIRETALTKDKEALEAYRKEWSQRGHNFNRTYLGSKPFKKANQDE